MTKKDLRTGHIITTRDGGHFRVMLGGHCLCTNYDVAVELNGKHWMDLFQFDDNMISNCKSNNDVMKVEIGTLTIDFAECDYSRIKKHKLWERKEYYNGKVVCIANGFVSSHLTIGKIYEFVDGIAKNDIGGSITFDEVKDFDDLRERFNLVKFIEVVE